MPSKVRLTDIAHASEVSTSTVSLVLRNKPGIPDATRRRVLAAAESLGYQRLLTPPEVDMAGGRPLQNLGLLVKADAGQAPGANPFYAHVLAGIEDACRTRHINLLYATLPVDAANRPTAAPRLLSADTVDGLLVVGALVDAPLYRLLGGGRLPLVLVDAYPTAELLVTHDAVLTDNFRGAAAAVDYLLACGHRCLGMIGGGDDAYPSLRDRRQGYRQALRMAGIAVDYLADCTPDDAEDATRSLLQANPQVTALFACNDHAALRAARAVQSLGLRVPQDISLVGFDDIELAAHVEPALTTMHVDKVALGRLAVQMLEARLAFPGGDRVTSLLHPHLVTRASVAAFTHAPDPADSVDSTMPI
jgi:LacI family transcriptional regulator